MVAYAHNVYLPVAMAGRATGGSPPGSWAPRRVLAERCRIVWARVGKRTAELPTKAPVGGKLANKGLDARVLVLCG